MKLVATQSYPYNGKSLAVGELFDSVSDDDARILKGTGKAKDAPAEVQDKAMKGDDAGGEWSGGPPGQPGQRPRRYNRRDMRAKD